MARTPLPEDAAPLELLRETGIPRDARLLTIVIGSYNHHRYLQEAFEAIEASKVCDHLAIVFIDDGSSDDTLSLVGDYPFDPSLHVRIYAKRNAGLRDTLASGLALTDTPFVAFIASDDRYDSNGLSAVMGRLQSAATEDICWIFQATYLDLRDGEPVYKRALAGTIDARPDQRERALSVEFPKPLLLQSSVFGSALLRAAQAWRDNLILDDWPTFVKVSHLASFRPVDMRSMFDIVLCRYRLHNSGAHNNLARQLAICMEVAERGVAPKYRGEAISNVYSDIALINLYQRNYGSALLLFARAVLKRPHLKTFTRPLKRIMMSIIRRLSKHG